MRIERFSSSQLAFLAGVAASVGVTFITAAATSDLDDIDLLIVSLPWFALSWLLAIVGSGIETARRRADLFDSPDLSERERIELVEFHAASVAKAQRLRHKLWAAAAAFAVGVVLSLALF